MRSRFPSLRPPGLALVAMIGLGAAAPPPAAAQAPAPAPGYPPPPPRFDGPPPPFEYPYTNEAAPTPAPAPTVAGLRRLSFTAALGPGALIGPGERSLAVTYQLFRLGVGLAPNLALMFGFDGVGTNSVNPATGLDSWLRQDVWSLGLQAHVRPALYVRGGMGLGFVSEKAGGRKFSGGRGVSASAAVGYELLQRQHVALSLDLNASLTKYARESWKTAGLQVALSIF